MKGKEIVPGKDPLLDHALAELRKGLKKGEDPFYVDLKARQAETEPSQADESIDGETDAPPVAGGPFALGRSGLQTAIIGVAAIIVIVGSAYIAGFFHGRSASDFPADRTNTLEQPKTPAATFTQPSPLTAPAASQTSAALTLPNESHPATAAVIGHEASERDRPNALHATQPRSPSVRHGETASKVSSAPALPSSPSTHTDPPFQKLE